LDGSETGAAFFVNGIFKGIELFDRAATFGRCFRSSSRVAVEAMMAQGSGFPPTGEDAEEISDYVKRILAEVGKSLSRSMNRLGWARLAVRRETVVWKALHYEADLIHFSRSGSDGRG